MPSQGWKKIITMVAQVAPGGSMDGLLKAVSDLWRGPCMLAVDPPKVAVYVILEHGVHVVVVRMCPPCTELAVSWIHEESVHMVLVTFM